ncbi:PH domain-containing protein [Paenibacillus sp. MBLB4367]|uniref:PH domain-containing protein n=1 Tax=Paenibacillus sp. MBLB4367 TaxID=3384767 RepID=UPI0039082731
MEEVLWEGKPFQFGWPSFTKYTLTGSRIIVEKGFFTKKRDEIRLYRIRDVSTKRSLWERMFRVGDVTLYSTDASNPQLVIRNIRRPIEVADLLGETVEQSRMRHKAMEVTEVSQEM